MRKVILVLGIVVGSVSLMQAQTLVPRIGTTISTTTIEQPNNEDQSGKITSQTGITFGLGYNVSVKALGKVMFSLQPELTYIQKGYVISTAGEYQIGEPIYRYTGESKFTINYFEIPVLAKFEFGGDKVKVGAFAGPSIGFGLGGKYTTVFNINKDEEGTETHKYEGDIVFYRPDGEVDKTELDHNIDFGVQMGASVTLMKYVQIDVRYGLGLTDVNHDDESKNRVLQFGVSVPITIK
jgi:hypothetical protein